MKKTYNKLRALTAAFGLLALGANAQISGVVTIDAGSPTVPGVNYQTFNALATALNTSGINGPLTVNVVNNTFVEQVTFNQITGMSATNRVIINGNNSLLTFPGTSGAPHTLRLNGTDYLTINNLRVQGTDPTYGIVCLLMGGANYNTFAACSFSCPANTTSSQQCPWAITSSPTSLSTNGSANYNTVTSCTIFSGYYGIFHYGGGTAALIDGNSFINTRITDWYIYCFYGYYSKNITFRGCTFDRDTRTNFTTTYLIMANYHENLMFEQNVIRSIFNTNPSYSGTFYGMYYIGANALNTSARNTIRNNIFRDIRQAGTTYLFYYNQACNNDYYNNTFSHDNNSTGTYYGFFYCYGSGTTNNTWTNNNFSISGGTSTRYAMYPGGNTLGQTFTNNNYYVTGTNAYVGYWTSNNQTLANWQTATGQEATSTSLNPNFVNVTTGDLHPTNVALNNTAIDLNLVFDQENAVRDPNTPDVGALEFLSPACAGTPSLNSVTSPTYAICPGEDVALGLGTLSNATGFTYQWASSTTSNVGPFTPINGATGLFYVAPSVTATTWYQVVQTCTNPGGSSTSPVGQVMVAGPTSTTVPYYENFEGIGMANRLPNCSWMATSMGSANKTYTSSNSGNRVPRSGVSFAAFDNSQTGTSSYYTNPIAMNVGITYSAAIWYATEYFGYSNWTNLSILVGPNQSATGLVQVASISPAISGPYKLLSNTFTVPSSGNYYVCIRATSAAGNAQYLSWDDLSVTIPCQAGSPNAPVVTISASSQTVCAGTPVNLTAAGANSFNWSTGATGASTSDIPLTNTVYAVTGLNSLSGCTSTETLAVQVDPAPNVFAVANSPVSCAGSPVMITAFNANSYAWSNGAQGPNVTVSPTVSTQYTVIGIGLNGCSAQYVANITVNPLPTINLLSSNSGEACKDDQLVLTASGAATYMWYSSSSPNVYQGSPITITAGASAIYTVMGTNANGCVGKQTITQSVSECTGLNKIAAALNGVSLYPNPTTGVFTVELNNGADKTVSVTDVTGRLIATTSGTDASFNMNLSNLAAGVYYVKVQSDNASTVLKVVKQ